MYYVNRFSEPSTDEWIFSIWKIKKIGPGAIPTIYKWIKKIYDPRNTFKVGWSDVIKELKIIPNEYGVIKEIFKG